MTERNVVVKGLDLIFILSLGLLFLRKSFFFFLVRNRDTVLQCYFEVNSYFYFIFGM